MIVNCGTPSIDHAGLAAVRPLDAGAFDAELRGHSSSAEFTATGANGSRIGRRTRR